MPYNEFGQFVPDETLSVDDMRHQLLAKNQTPKFIQNLEALYQLLPQNLVTRNVKPLTEATATVGSGLAAPFLGVAKGIGENIINRTNKKVDRPELAEPFTYQPRTEGGQQLVEQIMSGLEASKLPPYIAGGMGRFRFTPDDLRVAGKTAVSDVRNFPTDFANARAGFQREYPTLGSTAAGVVQRAEPLLEKGLSMYESGQLTPGFNPVSEAIKPKGGNWPTSLGSKLPLEEQGDIGAHFSSLIRDPIVEWEQQVRDIGVYDDWKKFKENNQNDLITKINNFTRDVNRAYPEVAIKTLGELTPLVEAHNNWIAGPYKKYITTQMGTGVETDPFLKAVDEANIYPFGRLLDWEAANSRENVLKDIANQNQEILKAKQKFEEDPEYYLEKSKKFPGLYPNPSNLFEYNPEQYKSVGIQTATSEKGKALENAQDFFLTDKGYNYSSLYPREFLETDFPVASKLKRNTPVYDLISSDAPDKMGMKAIRQKILSDLMSGKISPEKLPNISVEAVARDIIKTEQDKIKAATRDKDLYFSWRQKNHDSLPADVAFTDAEGNPTGEKMVVFDANMADANPDLVIRNLSQDTKELNHCVGSCGHGTAEYPNRHVPMVEPHTGTTPKGSDSTYGPNYIKKIKNGDIQIASLRGPNGESKATLELKPDAKHISMDTLDTMITDWLDNFNSEYLTKYNQRKSDRDIVTAVSDAQRDNPKLEEYIDDFMKKSSTSFRVDQIKGEGNRELKPDAVEAVKNWLNSKGDLVKLNRISDLDNLPGIIDLRNTKPHEIADIYQSINPDKLDSFLNDLVDKKLEGNELTKHRFEMGDIHPSEIIRDEIPRFVNIDDLRKVAEKYGYDIERRPEDIYSPKNQNLTELQKVVIESAVQDFHHGIDIGDLNDEYRANIEAILGLSGYQYRLPEHVHMELARKLLGGDEYRTWIQTTWNNARAASLEGLSLAQMDNVAHIIQNWLHLHPFAD